MRSLRIALLALLLPLAAAAQTIGSTSLLSLSISPQYPLPYGQAVVSVLSPSIDLANATMKVKVAGKEVYQGSVQPVPIRLGKAGSVSTIVVTITSAGASYTQSVTVQPEDVTLIAEPVSSAPAFYPGKPFVPVGGDTRVVAMANFVDAGGKTISPSALSYSWTVDGAAVSSVSGIGKQSLLVASPLQYRSRSVSVNITNQAGGLVGSASLTLSPQDPVVRIYENDPLLGIRSDHALSGSYTIAGSEDTLVAVPFSFPTTGNAPSITWSLDGTKAQTGSTITLRPSGNGQGGATLSVLASSGTALGAMEHLLLSFGAPSSSFFGL